MTLQPLGLLLTAALVIAVRLGDAWAYRRRVRARLLALIDRDNVAVENRLYRRHEEPASGGLTSRRRARA